MKILQVSWGLSPLNGGLSAAVNSISRELVRRGDQVTIFATDWNGGGRLSVPLRTPLHGDDGVERWYFPARPLMEYAISLSMAVALKERIPSFDIVHIHGLYRFPSTLASYYSRQTSTPYVVSPHGTLDPYLYNHHGLRKRIYEVIFERRALKGAAAVHFTAEEEMRLAKASGFQYRSVVAPLGINYVASDFAKPAVTLQDLLPQTRGKKVILFLGRITFKKGLDLLAKSFGSIARSRKDVHLIVAGPNEFNCEKELRNWLRQEGALDKVTFTGMISGKTKAAAFHGSDLFILPSYTENFGVAVVESLAWGLPVVISNKVNIWREIVGAGAGVAVDCDTQSIATAINELLDDTERRQNMSKRAVDLVRQRFTWQNAGDTLRKMYLDIVSEPRALVFGEKVSSREGAKL